MRALYFGLILTVLLPRCGRREAGPPADGWPVPGPKARVGVLRLPPRQQLLPRGGRPAAPPGGHARRAPANQCIKGERTICVCCGACNVSSRLPFVLWGKKVLQQAGALLISTLTTEIIRGILIMFRFERLLNWMQQFVTQINATF